ncbi:DNA mismatch repair protein MutS [Entomortierella parvispora]|uniref:DNA mismatch repair protein MutS n=1 Tax=Entomortierella parvispora TaxID=205924 RepID=A0A9P3HCF0_9FUNG|nr:DNA mismatch repair protein MutS [Entomortierella parvispora]
MISTARKGPRVSVLPVSSLESVNPNPTVFTSEESVKSTHEQTSPRKGKARKKKGDLDDKTVTVKLATRTKAKTPRLSPLRKQILDLEAAYPDCVLLVRVGEFYELYDHNAEEYGHLLGLRMGSKTFSGETVAFTGFPYKQLDQKLEILVSKHSLKVALCEQFQDEEPGSRAFRRSVHRIITSGTLIDEQFLNQNENNWLLAVATDKSSRMLGLSWLDISTGDFFTQETNYDSFANDLARIRPREIILNANLRNDPDHEVRQTIERMGHFVVSFEYMRTAAQMAIQNENEILEDAMALFDFDPSHLEPFSNRTQSACLAILRYVNHTQMGRKPVVQRPIEWKDGSIVKIDRNTIEALELVRTLRDSSRAGSLLHHIDRTKTKAGSRLLADWLTSPLTSIEQINGRLDMVEFLKNDSHLMHDMNAYLTECRDAQRALQKLSLGQIDPQDLVAIRVTMEALQKIKSRITDKITRMKNSSGGGISSYVPDLVQETADNIKGLEPICELIRKVVDESMEQNQDYGFINEDVSPELTALHQQLKKLKSRKRAMLERWTTYLGGAKPFEVKSSFGYRHIVELRSSASAERLKAILDGKVVDVSHTDQRHTKIRYQVPVLTEMMDCIEQLEGQIVQQEKSILNATRAEILEESTAIVMNCRYIAKLDVLLAFAKMAIEQHYIRPVLNDSQRTLIAGGRHPVVELALQHEGRHFVKNDCSVGQDELIWLLTGPNMGGKSTFLRQNAILTIMAQMGSFVPAARAELGIVDKVFSRLGGADNLANSQSTFMVEMTETASILQHATERSLVIMDEVGRGTSTLDGCAIAYSTLHHLYHVNKCRTLFATHYHELADMSGAAPASAHTAVGALDDGSTSANDIVSEMVRSWRGLPPLEKVRCYQTTLEPQSDGTFTYIHMVQPGVCRRSHGIYVARLAGMPQSAIDVSKQILHVLQQDA